MPNLHAEAHLIRACSKSLTIRGAVLLCLLRELQRLALRYLVPVRPHQLTCVALDVFVDRGQLEVRRIDRLLLAFGVVA